MVNTAFPTEDQNGCNEKLYEKAQQKAATTKDYFALRVGFDNIANLSSTPAEAVCGIATSKGIVMSEDGARPARGVRTSVLR